MNNLIHQDIFLGNKNNIPIEDIVMYYKLNGNAIDSSLNTLHGIPTSIDWSTDKIAGDSSAHYNNNGDKIVVPYNSKFAFSDNIQDESFTITFWIKATSWGTNPRIIDKAEISPSANRDYRIIFVNGQFRAVVFSATGNIAVSHEINTNPLNTWIFCSFRYKRNGELLTLGIDENFNSDFSPNPSFSILSNSSCPLTIGMDNYYINNSLRGYLDEVVFWNGYLKDDVIKAIRKKGLNGLELI